MKSHRFRRIGDHRIRANRRSEALISRATRGEEESRLMLSAEQNDLITRTLPGTAAGALLRR
jgi:hypothetical protein